MPAEARTGPPFQASAITGPVWLAQRLAEPVPVRILRMTSLFQP